MSDVILDEGLVREVSLEKSEPGWMLDYRLKSLGSYRDLDVPSWCVDVSGLRLDEISYYVKSKGKGYKSWDEVPEDVREVFEKIGVPETERKYLAGAGSQVDSEMIYHNLKRSLKKKGVVFLSMDDGLREYEDLVREYFGSVVPVGDNKFSDLNGSVWSGGSFVYVPKGVSVGLPLSAYFRIETEKMGQFERSLIVADEGSEVEYVEGCSAPAYSSGSLHAGVVEVVVKKGASVKYVTVQNWYKNVYNLVTKRALVEDGGVMRWVDCNVGSKVTMKYPCCLLKGEGSVGEMLSISVAGGGQFQDAGAKMIHSGNDTRSKIVSRSIVKDGGRSSYRGVVGVGEGVCGARSKVVCDSLIMDDESRVDSYPSNVVSGDGGVVEHEAVVSRMQEDVLLYLQSRGFSEDDASSMVVIGFVDPIIEEIPFEYAVELNRLIKMDMKGAVG